MSNIRTTLFGLILLVTTACNMSEPKELGVKFEVNNPMSIDELVEQMKIQPQLENIQLKGEINKSCLSEGCWFTIKDKNGNSYTIDVKDEQFRLPNTSAGKIVIALLDAKTDTTDNEPELILETTGIKYIDDKTESN